jgi:hypothetical protein
MAVGQKRGSRPAGAESPAVRGGDGQPVAVSVDGLLARVAHGDAEAFAAIYDQVADAVHGLMRRIVGDQSRAEQLTAEALVEVWRSASQREAVLLAYCGYTWRQVSDLAGVPAERLRGGSPEAGQPQMRGKEGRRA